MDEHAAEGKLTALVTDYARSRAVAVSRGEETPGLAALLVGRYGRGIYDAADVLLGRPAAQRIVEILDREVMAIDPERSEEHTSELPLLMRNSYAVFCLKKKRYIHRL